MAETESNDRWIATRCLMKRHARFVLIVGILLSASTILQLSFFQNGSGKRLDRIVADMLDQGGAAVLQRGQNKPPATHVANLVEHLLFNSSDLGENKLTFSPPAPMIQEMVQHWNPCTLNQTLQQARTRKKNQSLHVVFLGGSATARTPNNCSAVKGGGKGRYSDILQRKVEEDLSAAPNSFGDFPRFEWTNMGQGGIDSFWSALTLDETVDKNNTDILVWEFAINDADLASSGRAARSLEALEAVMDVWLWRVSRHFDGRPPPLILFYLWDAHVDRQLKNSTSTGIPQKAFESHMNRLVDHYRSFGWSISVINLGGLVDPTYAQQNMETLVDDSHHPSCYCENLISGLFRLVLYSDLASCTPQQLASSTSTTTRRTQSHLPNPMKPLLSSIVKEEEDINPDEDNGPLKALLDEDIVVGSKMEWQPKLEYSNLLLSSNGNVLVESAMGSKTSAGRVDRKLTYTIPLCPETWSITIQNPNLEWIGVKFAGEGDYSMKYLLDGVKVKKKESRLQNSISFDTKGRIGFWSQVNKKDEYHNLTFCNDLKDWSSSKTSKFQKFGRPSAHLNWLVGLFRRPS